MLLYSIVAIVAYLLGSIPFGFILVLVFLGADVRQTGSGNIGATNVARTGSKGLAIATLFLDALKGSAAVLFAFSWGGHHVGAQLAHRSSLTEGQFDLLMASSSGLGVQQHLYLLAAIAAFFAILGHVFTPWLRFKGGKGVATGMGVFLALAPKAVLVVLVIFVLIVAVTRYISLGSVVAAAMFPVAFFFLYRDFATPLVLAMIAGVSLLIIYRHKDNIRRLTSGTESKFGSKGAPMKAGGGSS
jgi:acyl phosphate:glycerol-3-phosphate acyltransferase